VRQTVIPLIVALQAVVIRVNTRVIGGREVEPGQPNGREIGRHLDYIESCPRRCPSIKSGSAKRGNLEKGNVETVNVRIESAGRGNFLFPDLAYR
jgi:hypothetical protein